VIGNAVHVMRIARVQSSRRLEREAGRNLEVMWPKGRALPDHQTLADFRKDNGRAIRQVCSLQPAALRVLANDTDTIVALLKRTTGRDAGLIATTQSVAA
jgi:Transposase domain (DUF772)